MQWPGAAPARVRPWFQISGFHPATNRQLACRRQAYAVRHASVRRAHPATASAPPPACARHRQCVAHVACGRSNLAPAIHAATHCGGSFGGRHLVHVHFRLHGLTIHSSRRLRRGLISGVIRHHATWPAASSATNYLPAAALQSFCQLSRLAASIALSSVGKALSRACSSTQTTATLSSVAGGRPRASRFALRFRRCNVPS